MDATTTAATVPTTPTPTTPTPTTPTPTTPTKYPAAVYRPVTNKPVGIIQPTRGLVPHVQFGTGSMHAYFDDPASRTSAHLWLAKDGRFEQYVPFDRRARALGAGDAEWISCVCEGLVTEDYTDIQVQRLGEFYRWGVEVFGWKLEVTDSTDGYGIGTHVMGGAAWAAQSCEDSCPGALRTERRQDILDAGVVTSDSQDTGPDDGPPGSEDRFEGMPTLSLGAHRSEVGVLQDALNIALRHEAPADPQRLKIDNHYGQRTAARVAVFQRSATAWFGRLPSDEVCGARTWRKLGVVLTGMNR